MPRTIPRAHRNAALSEPAVMMATLQVHEAMGVKVEREAVATLVLPQLWAMCVGPLLNVEQFGRFMQCVPFLLSSDVSTF